MFGVFLWNFSFSRFIPIMHIFRFCYHWASVIRLLLAFCILINSSKTTGPIWTKLGWSPFRNVSDNPPCQPRWLPLLKIENSAKKSLKNYLLWNCLANWAQTMVEWSSDSPLWELCPMTPAANQDSRHY
jgi:hypothetical protein